LASVGKRHVPCALMPQPGDDPFGLRQVHRGLDSGTAPPPSDTAAPLRAVRRPGARRRRTASSQPICHEVRRRTVRGRNTQNISRAKTAEQSRWLTPATSVTSNGSKRAANAKSHKLLRQAHVCSLERLHPSAAAAARASVPRRGSVHTAATRAAASGRRPPRRRRDGDGRGAAALGGGNASAARLSTRQLFADGGES
jgi:hypothetical protein